MQPVKLISFVLASLAAAPSLAVTISQFSQLKTLNYDYVIIGGIHFVSPLESNKYSSSSTSWKCRTVLASRLSEDPSVTVSFLRQALGVVPAEAPFLGPTVTPNTPYDWNYTITAQTGMNGRTFPYPRGRLLGGLLLPSWGSNEDWNRLASISGDPGWAWSNMRNYIQRHEKLVPPADGHNTTGQIIPSLHGTNGMLPLAEFPYNGDMSGGDHSLLGIGWLKSSMAGGVRSSSSTTYLAAANGRPISLSSSMRSTIVVTARREVILSAGSVGTAQILQLSGIGNQNDLSALKINTIINNPSVGANLSDHTSFQTF
ncbi:aryl alcohol oxidase [Pholiota molesta]|nr:aryl alcohol oxidase [Pholiota molesta]